MKLEDMQKMTEAEMAYTVLCQLAGAQAMLANLLGRSRADDKRWKPKDFMIRSDQELAAERAGKTTALMEAFRRVGEFAADLPTVVEKNMVMGVDPAEDAEVALCGCTVMKGWRCPVHDAP